MRKSFGIEKPRSFVFKPHAALAVAKRLSESPCCCCRHKVVWIDCPLANSTQLNSKGYTKAASLFLLFWQLEPNIAEPHCAQCSTLWQMFELWLLAHACGFDADQHLCLLDKLPRYLVFHNGLMVPLLQSGCKLCWSCQHLPFQK